MSHPIKSTVPIAGQGALEDSHEWLQKIVDEGLLTAVFQPLVDFRSGEIFGYEGLSRGPSSSPLRLPAELFAAARLCGMSLEVESCAQSAVLSAFARQHLPGKIFINVSPERFVHRDFHCDDMLAFVRTLGLTPRQVVIELTENQPTADFRGMREALLVYRRAGFEIALDDLGEGFASLRLWSELQPDYVKIDMHFVQGINLDSLKFQFLKAIQQIAQSEGSRVIAEGIETAGELRTVRDLGIPLGQGYFIARPNGEPERSTPSHIREAVGSGILSLYPVSRSFRQPTAEKLLISAEPVSPDVRNDQVFALFEAEKHRQLIAVVRDDGEPLGLIARYRFTDAYARPYRRELFGRQRCEMFVDRGTLIVDRDIRLQDLSQAIVDPRQADLLDGFIITEGGRYAGIGLVRDLLREVADLQVQAARHSNPLTLLPGSVPVNEHIDRLLQSGVPFCACYCDLDNFKPFNDLYGYQRGDELILLTAQVLVSCCDPDLDFVGHIGGDDFFLLFQSADWQQRCQSALREYERSSRLIFSPEDLERGGMAATDRRGNPAFYPLTALSIGAVTIEPGVYSSHKEVSAAATEAKSQAKRQPGHTLFVERRRPTPQPDTPL